MVDNKVTWNRTVMVAVLVTGLVMNFPRLLLGELHEWAFKTTTTYHFPSMIFQLCKDAGVPIWHCDKLVYATWTLDIGLIQDDANGDGPPTVDPPDEHPSSSSQKATYASSSSRATPLSGTTMIPLARVQKLDGQMATLLHHIKPWMRKLIAESKERVEKRMEAKMNQKVQEVHKRLDAFELRVIERPTPTTDMSSLRTKLTSLRSDVDAILATPSIEPQAASSALGDDTVLGALFSGDDVEEQPEHTSACNEQLRQQRTHEMIAGASSSIPVRIDVSTTEGAVRVIDSTTDGAILVEAGTTEGDPSVDLAGSGKPDPPAC
uniref:Integrase core domain containing protein n=1 Tax=Solanum tuberosum TaxID=4113 RepID=M1E166_SOLTU